MQRAFVNFVGVDVDESDRFASARDAEMNRETSGVREFVGSLLGRNERVCLAAERADHRVDVDLAACVLHQIAHFGSWRR